MSKQIHHIPGRMRLRSEMTRNFPGGPAALEQRFRAVQGVTSTQISPRTGSVTILYDPRAVDPQHLRQIAGASLPTGSDTRPGSGRKAATLTKAGQLFGKAAFDVFVAKALERSVVSVLVALR